MQEKKYIWVIGDIHGLFDPLNYLLNYLKKTFYTHLAFVGDYLDNGPSSKEVIDLLMTIPEEKATFLLGNHEYLLLNALENNPVQVENPIEYWLENGGKSTMASYGYEYFSRFKANFPVTHYQFLKRLKISDKFVLKNSQNTLQLAIVHSGVDPNKKVKHQLKLSDYNEINTAVLSDKLVLKRTPFFIRKHFFHAHPSAWKKYLVVHGHTPTQTLPRRLANLHPPRKETARTILKHGFYYNHLPYLRKHPNKEKTVSVDIDTGAVTGNRLSAVGFSTDNMGTDKMLIDIVQVDVSKAYKGDEVLKTRKGEIVY